MRDVVSVSELPYTPAVYAMYGGQSRGLYVAYVGVAGQLRSRIEQHLIRRDSSVTTGTSAVQLNPDKVTQLQWWEHPGFADRRTLEAAEMVAFNILEPALRSRGADRRDSRELFQDETFRSEMYALLQEHQWAGL